MSCSAHMRRKPFTRATTLGFEPRITLPKGRYVIITYLPKDPLQLGEMPELNV